MQKKKGNSHSTENNASFRFMLKSKLSDSSSLILKSYENFDNMFNLSENFT